MTDVRQAWVAMLGDDLGNRVADDMAEAMGRTLDTTVFYGTNQENEMNTDQITEVSTTVDAGLAQEDLEHLGDAERLGLIVGAAYGRALAERDEARAQVAHLGARLNDARDLLRTARPLLEDSTWATDSSVASSIQAFLDRVDSELAPTQED